MKRSIDESQMTSSNLERKEDDEYPAKVEELTTSITASTVETMTNPTMPMDTTTIDSTEATPVTTQMPSEKPMIVSFKPIAFYYGGQPNSIADTIYFTTIDPPNEQTTNDNDGTQAPNLFHGTAENQDDNGKFKPSIQYEFKNYRFDVDEHFIPIIGPKQIF